MEEKNKSFEERLTRIEKKLDKILNLLEDGKKYKDKNSVKNVEEKPKTTAYETYQRGKRWQKEKEPQKALKVPKELLEIGKEEKLVSFGGVEIIKSQADVLRRLEGFYDKKFNIFGEDIFNPMMSFREVKNRVTILGLAECKISVLPDFIEDLKTLQILVLSWNDLHDIPNCIGELRFLEEIYLEHNSLEYIPSKITELKNLNYLNLENNKLRELPKNLGNLKSLEILRLNENNIMHIPESIGQMRNLYECYLNDNQLTELPDSIINLDNLEVLALDNNQLESLPENIGSLDSLVSLSLVNNNLRELPESLKDLSRLQYLKTKLNPLDLSGESKTGKIIEFLKSNGVKV